MADTTFCKVHISNEQCKFLNEKVSTSAFFLCIYYNSSHCNTLIEQQKSSILHLDGFLK